MYYFIQGWTFVYITLTWLMVLTCPRCLPITMVHIHFIVIFNIDITQWDKTCCMARLAYCRHLKANRKPFILHSMLVVKLDFLLFDPYVSCLGVLCKQTNKNIHRVWMCGYSYIFYMTTRCAFQWKCCLFQCVHPISVGCVYSSVFPWSKQPNAESYCRGTALPPNRPVTDSFNNKHLCNLYNSVILE